MTCIRFARTLIHFCGRWVQEPGCPPVETVVSVLDKANPEYLLEKMQLQHPIWPCDDATRRRTAAVAATELELWTPRADDGGPLLGAADSTPFGDGPLICRTRGAPLFAAAELRAIMDEADAHWAAAASPSWSCLEITHRCESRI